MGKDEETIVERARQFNGPLPDKILNAPELQPGLELYINAFNTLSPGRNRGDGWVGSIPYIAVSQYLRDHSIDGDDWANALDILGKLDEAYCEWQNDHIKKGREAAAKAAKAKAPTGRQKR